MLNEVVDTNFSYYTIPMYNVLKFIPFLKASAVVLYLSPYLTNLKKDEVNSTVFF